MTKLLRGDFIRLFKSKIFWLCVIFMFGFASMAVYTKWSDSKLVPDYYNPPDGLLLAGAAYLGIVIAVVLGIFIGTDYSHGTIRNKISVGIPISLCWTNRPTVLTHRVSLIFVN